MTYEINNSANMNILNEINLLISQRKLSIAESKLNSLSEKSAYWHFIYSKLLLSKSWFDAANEHLELSITMDPTNEEYKKTQLSLMSRYRRYSDDYYDTGYRRRRRGCSCCCCDDCCCCDCNISCCDLICLDQCCECMGGDFIECI